ncbi:hypothetical protein KCU97_g19816, partial [Aureobasidium melanogenum]
MASAPQTRCAFGPAPIVQSAIFAKVFTAGTNSICKPSVNRRSSAELIAELQTA